METFPTINLLVVDDEEHIRNVVKKILKPLNSKFFAAENGRDAIEVLKKNKIDVMITDIMMPEMNGLELLEYTSRLHPNLIPLVLTAYGDKKVLLKSIELKVYDFLEKPFTAEVIQNRVGNAFRLCKQKRNLELAVREFVCSYCQIASKEEFDQMSEDQRQKTLEAGIGVIKIKNVNLAA